MWVNDNLTYLIEMYKAFQLNDIDVTIMHIENRIRQFELSLTNEYGFKKAKCPHGPHRNLRQG